jgi:hypothetical protein
MIKRIRILTVPLTNGSGSGSRRPKNFRIQICSSTIHRRKYLAHENRANVTKIQTGQKAAVTKGGYSTIYKVGKISKAKSSKAVR